MQSAAVWILIASLGFLSLSALLGGGMLIADPSGRLLRLPTSRRSLTKPVPGAILFAVSAIKQRTDGT